jgi:predicted metal-dependent hydrolase
MASITARIPQIDWDKGFDRNWYGGNAAATHAFNALSFLFPQGERFFIDVAHEVARTLDLTNDPDLGKAIKGFIAQESVHNYQHTRYNEVLQAQGFENVTHKYVLRLQERSRRSVSPLARLAVVAAYEHYTAVLGNYILSNPQVLEPAQPDMALVWGWHSAEETEHKAACFDLYRAAGGGWVRRVLVFLLVTMNFCLMFNRLYLSLLWRDGCLRSDRILKTIGQALQFFFGRSGVGWYLVRDGLRYLSPSFHPWNQDNRKKMQSWLAANQAKLREVAESPDANKTLQPTAHTPRRG